MTTTSRNQSINDLRARIKLLERQQSGSSQHLQEKLLMQLVGEAIQQADTPEDLLLQVLERTTVILDLPLGAFYEVIDNKALPVEVYDLNMTPRSKSYGFGFDRQIAAELKKGPLILSYDEDDFSRIRFESYVAVAPRSIAMFPFQSLYIPFGLFVLYGHEPDKEIILSVSPVIRQLLQFTVEKLEKLKLMQELKDLNHSFDEELERRTGELKSSNEKLRQQIQDLQKKQKQTPGKEITNGQGEPGLLHSFLRSIGLEIRTPLNGIMGFAELIRDNSLSTQEQNNYVDIIKSCGKSLVKIVDDALEFSMIKLRQLDLNRTEFPLAPFMTELYDHYKKDELFRRRENLELRINLNINGTSLIFADRDKLKLILTNLIGNAIKFTESGFIEFGCTIQEPKSKRSKAKKQDVIFFVKDTGVGISKENADKIFHEFYKVEHEISKLYGGLGLGLTIAKVLVEMMGGKIWFDSDPGKGSSFYFSVPEAMDVTEYDLEILAENGLDKLLDWSKKKILIVEDDPMSVIYLKEAIKSTGAQLMHASDGKSAVDIVNSGIPIDLILMDIKLPGMSGYEATRRIKSVSDIPIIAQTAYAMADDYKKILQVGCDDYISKPINRKKLLKKIQDIFTKDDNQ